jgi:hypothetical protein
METTKRKARKKFAGAHRDLRMLIATASVAATVGGASLFAVRDSSAALPQPAAPAAQPQPSTGAPAALPDLSPLPTIVPATGDTGITESAPQPTATPVPNVLPQVSVPQQRQWRAPMAITRSSR